MSESKEVVQRLRDRCSYGDARLWQKHDPLCEKAADLIERQAQIIEEMGNAWFDYDVFPTKTNRSKLESVVERVRALTKQ